MRINFVHYITCIKVFIFCCLDQKDDLKGEYSVITNTKLTVTHKIKDLLFLINAGNQKLCFYVEQPRWLESSIAIRLKLQISRSFSI